MKVSAARIISAVLACWLLSACSQWNYDLGAPLYDQELPPQNTSLSDVLDLLGPPLRMSATDTGFVLAWEHWNIREQSLGFSLGAMGADFLSADWGDMRITGDFLLLTFNEQHLLTSATRSSWDNDGGGGQAIQPFFNFVSVVDADDLTESMPQHRWGSSLLQRLPGTLNEGSDLDTGRSGLQQRGTPTAAGQQSLQMN
jgi:hypothetical protein